MNYNSFVFQKIRTFDHYFHTFNGKLYLILNNILYKIDLKTEIEEENIEFKGSSKLFFFKNYFVTISSDFCRIYDLENHFLLQEFKEGHIGIIYTIISLKNNKFATSSSCGSIKIWDSKKGCIMELAKDSKVSFYSLTELPNGNIICSGYKTGIRTYNINTGDLICKISEDKYSKYHNTPIYSLVCPNERILIMASSEKCTIWDLKDWKCNFEIDIENGAINSLYLFEKEVIIKKRMFIDYTTLQMKQFNCCLVSNQSFIYYDDNLKKYVLSISNKGDENEIKSLVSLAKQIDNVEFQNETEIQEALNFLEKTFENWKNSNEKYPEIDNQVKIEWKFIDDKVLVHKIHEVYIINEKNNITLFHEIDKRSISLISDKKNRKLSREECELISIQEIVNQWKQNNFLDEEMKTLLQNHLEKGIELINVKKNFKWEMVPKWKQRRDDLIYMLHPFKMILKIKELEKRIKDLEEEKKPKSKMEGLFIEQ